jgi:hypothetical protein
MTDVTFATSGYWLVTRIGVDGAATLGWIIFYFSPWLHGQQLDLIFEELFKSLDHNSISMTIRRLRPKARKSLNVASSILIKETIIV